MVPEEGERVWVVRGEEGPGWEVGTETFWVVLWEEGRIWVVPEETERLWVVPGEVKWVWVVPEEGGGVWVVPEEGGRVWVVGTVTLWVVAEEEGYVAVVCGSGTCDDLCPVLLLLLVGSGTAELAQWL